jgi:hypothetical protein
MATTPKTTHVESLHEIFDVSDLLAIEDRQDSLGHRRIKEQRDPAIKFEALVAVRQVVHAQLHPCLPNPQVTADCSFQDRTRERVLLHGTLFVHGPKDAEVRSAHLGHTELAL